MVHVAGSHSVTRNAHRSHSTHEPGFVAAIRNMTGLNSALPLYSVPQKLLANQYDFGRSRNTELFTTFATRMGDSEAGDS